LVSGIFLWGSVCDTMDLMKRALLTSSTRRRLALALLLYCLPILLFAKLAQEITGPSLVFDTALLHWIHGWASPTWDRVALIVTNFGSPEATVGMTAFGIGGLWLLRRRWAAVVLMLGVGGAAIINTFLKLEFHRLRPSLWQPLVTEQSFSFPSGHAMVSSALVCSVVYILWHTRWRWWAIVAGGALTVLIGLSRLYLGVHYPTDVLAGWTVGFIWVVIVRAVLLMSVRWWRQEPSDQG